MISTKAACEIIRQIPEVKEKDHFGSDAFSGAGRMFATVWHDEKKVNVRLSPALQKKYLELDSEAFTEIDNSWGRQGWTGIQLDYVDRNLFCEIVKEAWDFSKIKSPSSGRSASKKANPKPVRRKGKSK